MHPFTFFGNLIWFPRALHDVDPRPKHADATNAGFLAGLIGLGGFLAWLIPPDYLGKIGRASCRERVSERV
jgi:hypothetical protein